MRDEIQAGLKNAIERGSSLDEAIQSFISAGYNPVEVKEAASDMGSGATAMFSAPAQAKNPAQVKGPVKDTQFNSSGEKLMTNFTDIKSPFPLQPSQQSPQAQELRVPDHDAERGMKSKRTVILLSIFLVILLGLLVGLIVFSKQILDLLK